MSEIKGTVANKGAMQGSLQSVLGKDGISAYEVAVKNGFEGTETEWLESLHGKDGYTPIKGVDYFDGAKGEQGIQGGKGDKGDKGDTGSSGVYVGSGDMPDDCNVQIDPDGVVISLKAEIKNNILYVL